MIVTSYANALNEAMHSGMEKNPNSFIIGQGVTDHKAIFGSTLGISKKFGNHRIIESPISEDSMTGIGLGASINGLYPIMTHIRLDFSLLAMNQIINLYAKYRYMFDGQFTPKGLIRMVVGRSWGQGAQHAQSLQSLFSHIPGLTVIMPSNAKSIRNCYDFAINKYNAVVISIEHRNLYDIEFNDDEIPLDNDENPPWNSSIARVGSDITIIGTSIMVLESLRAANHLEIEYGISCEVIDLESTSHIDKSVILNSVSKTGRLLIADTSWIPYGVSAEISRIICEENPRMLKSPVKYVGMEFTPCPTGKTLEDQFYPSIRTITKAVLDIVEERKSGILPSGESYRDFYRKFRGPF